jgi:hypothetical protein
MPKFKTNDTFINSQKRAPTNIFITQHDDTNRITTISLVSALFTCIHHSAHLIVFLLYPHHNQKNVEKTALVALVLVHLDGKESCLGIFIAANIILASEWTKSAFENAPPCFDQYTA